MAASDGDQEVELRAALRERKRLGCFAGGQSAPPSAPPSPPLYGRVHQGSNPSRRMGFAVGDAPWFGPQRTSSMDGPALMEAGTEGRYAASLLGAWPHLAGHRATQREAFARTTERSKGVAQRP
jgi:hypothetical protein